METDTLGILLKRYRLHVGLTQEELAERAGVSVRSVSDIERGLQQRPHISTLRRLADGLTLAPELRVAFLHAGRGDAVQSPTESSKLGREHMGGSASAGPSTNLPDEPTSFIGREREIAAVAGLLRRPGVRLVTLTGPGGVGKSRLALRVASRLLGDYRDAVFLVTLASLTDPGLIAPALARTLGVPETPGAPLTDTLRRRLRDRRILLILDNFEHLLDSAPVVGELLDACRELRVLVTSRIPLHLAREHEYPVPPLSLPGPGTVPGPEALCRFEAAALFVERARAVMPEFEVTPASARAVAGICSRLDGLPLAIELAATRIKLFSPQSLLQRLDSCLSLLTGGARDVPTRQQTLRATIDWSYGLLSPEEQALFARLSVFVGGCTLEAAEAVCNADGALDVLDGMASLVDKSLMYRQGDVEPRFFLLETIREYAGEKLTERGEVEEMRRRHAGYFVDSVMPAEPHLGGEREAAWFERFDRDRENIREAVHHYRIHRPDDALLVGFVLHQYWIMRGELRERVRWLEDVREHNARLPAVQRLKVLDLAVHIADGLGHPLAEGLFEQSVALREELGDMTGKRDALEREARRLVRAGQLQEALELFEDSRRLQRSSGWRDNLNDSIHYTDETLVGAMATAQSLGDYALATAYAEEGLALATDRKYTHDIARFQTFLGWLALMQGGQNRAKELLERGLEVQRALGDKNCMPTSLMNLAILALERGDPDAATQLAEEGLGYVQELEQTGRVAEHLAILGRAALMAGRLEEAGERFQAGLRLAGQAENERARADAFWGLAELAGAQRDWKRATELAGLAGAALQACGYRPAPIERSRQEELLARVRSHLGDQVPANSDRP